MGCYVSAFSVSANDSIIVRLRMVAIVSSTENVSVRMNMSASKRVCVRANMGVRA